VVEAAKAYSGWPEVLFCPVRLHDHYFWPSEASFSFDKGPVKRKRRTGGDQLPLPLVLYGVASGITKQTATRCWRQGSVPASIPDIAWDLNGNRYTGKYYIREYVV
jgi:hypothetical protein